MVLLALVMVAAVTASSPLGTETYERQLDQEELKWWQTGVIYQIYPASFKDSDGDGIGDLKGIISKLEYLKFLGVSAILISTIYKTAGSDLGSDIVDFKNIDNIFGTIQDFEELVTSAHSIGLKVVLDFVPNHSSVKHEWFQKDSTGNDDYKDYYVWKEKPNEWMNVNNGSPSTGWEHESRRGSYYLHQFNVDEPDLNYNNNKVVKEMEDVLRFWLDKDIDGFNMRQLSHLFEDPEWRNSPLGSFQYQVHQPQTYDMIQKWREMLDNEGERRGKDLVLMIEVWATGETLGKYFGTPSRPGAHIPINTGFISNLPENIDEGQVTAEDIKYIIDAWYSMLPEHGWPNWMIGNEDVHRIGSRVGADLIDAFNMLVTLLPGTTITYYGEEIGMLDNTDIAEEYCRDETSCPYGMPKDKDEYYRSHTRNFQRTPFQWNESQQAGFSTAKPWLPVNKNYLTENEKYQETDIKSHLNVYEKLLSLRKELVIKKGYFSTLNTTNNVLMFSRQNISHVFLVLINFAEEARNVSLTEVTELESLPKLQVYVSNFDMPKDNIIAMENVCLPAHASVVFFSQIVDSNDSATSLSTLNGFVFFIIIILLNGIQHLSKY